MRRRLVVPLVLALATLIGAVAYCFAVARVPAYRVSLELAGDQALPGASMLQRPSAVARLIREMARDSTPPYAALLRLDDGLVFLSCAFLASLAWAIFRTRHKVWLVPLVTAGAAYGIAAWTDHAVQRHMLTHASSIDRLAVWAVIATTTKWLFLIAAGLAAFFAALRLIGRMRAWLIAFFHDVPAIVDSIWRRNEFLANREFEYSTDAAGLPVKERSSWRKPHFLFFALTLVFVAYGPTLTGFCSLAPQTWSRLLPFLPGIAALWLLWALGPFFCEISSTVTRRFLEEGRNFIITARTYRETGATKPDVDFALLRERLNVTRAAMLAGTLLILAPAFGAIAGLVVPALYDFSACSGISFHPASLGRLLVCVLAILAFAWACKLTQTTTWLLVWQALIMAVAAVLFWHVFSSEQDTEALGRGYRHVFGMLAPALVISLVTAPILVAWFLRPSRRPAASWLRIGGISQQTRSLFRVLLRQRELFIKRPRKPQLQASRVVFAVFQGLSGRALQLLLPPALFVFVAPSDWVDALAGYGLLLSILLGTWGNMSRRWQQMSRHVARWFLSGTALFVSLFVIALSTARWFDVDYVTTIMDAAPFGVLFAFVLMSYLLSWLVEYWINRAVAVELLEVLGGDRGTPSMPYPYARPRPGPGIQVAVDRRMLSYHGLGRFAVIGTLLPGHKPTASKRARNDAFHTYDLLELFQALVRRDNDRMAEVVRCVNLYFYFMNLVLIAVFLALGITYWHLSRKGPDSVITASSTAHAPGVVDLAERLRQQGAAGRPAVVVIASGGGTRAALYTSHVLEGLHALGVDRDIVLASGVSGGGVALAYFAAHFDTLTAEGVPDRWKRFRADVGSNLIRNVLEGASEWRIFGTTPLSILLAESFERHLLRDSQATTMAVRPPALILNTTVTAHPAEESDVLIQTLDPARRRPDCADPNRPFRMMGGGRLVFTNLSTVSKFPARSPEISDTRLPYVVIADRTVSIAHAAALNANFPPVFPSAKVTLTDAVDEALCPKRSYFVTDGGALENLGLISALYALDSALAELRVRCAKQRCTLPSIHIVIAEASATAYDYAPDRGLGVALGSAKERLTGELTNELLKRTRTAYAGLGGDADQLKPHYLPLPLTFRARGGLGTHWMLASRFELHDPRPRTVASAWSARMSAPRSVTITSDEIEQAWLALHDVHLPYCGNRHYGTVVTDTVRRWICGTAKDGRARDLHIEAWQTIVDDLSS